MSKKAPEKTLANEAMPAKPRRTTHGPEPERFKIEGYKNWEDAVEVAMRAKKPAGGWPK
jgi:hypothetical protein